MSEPRRNKVFKSLHKPLTYMGIERSLFIMTVTAAMTTFEVSHSMLAGLTAFAGCGSFGYWATQKDPAYLKIVFQADRFKSRYDAAKQQVPNVEIR